MAPDIEHLGDQIAYLMDRAAISDLIISFARTLDTKDFAGYADLFTEDGIIEVPVKLPDGSFFRHVGREGLAELVSGDGQRTGLARFAYTHHLSANHQITIDGDTATACSYAHCIHRLSDDPADVWELGGWYFCELRRTENQGWKFANVRLEKVWEHGKPEDHG